MSLDIHVPSYSRWRRLMMPVVPAMGMVIITMIIVGLITARQGKGHDEAKKPEAQEVLYSVFHGRLFVYLLKKPCQPVTYYLL